MDLLLELLRELLLELLELLELLLQELLLLLELTGRRARAGHRGRSAVGARSAACADTCFWRGSEAAGGGAVRGAKAGAQGGGGRGVA